MIAVFLIPDSKELLLLKHKTDPLITSQLSGTSFLTLGDILILEVIMEAIRASPRLPRRARSPFVTCLSPALEASPSQFGFLLILLK